MICHVLFEIMREKLKRKQKKPFCCQKKKKRRSLEAEMPRGRRRAKGCHVSRWNQHSSCSSSRASPHSFSSLFQTEWILTICISISISAISSPSYPTSGPLASTYIENLKWSHSVQITPVVQAPSLFWVITQVPRCPAPAFAPLKSTLRQQSKRSVCTHNRGCHFSVQQPAVVFCVAQSGK